MNTRFLLRYIVIPNTATKQFLGATVSILTLTSTSLASPVLESRNFIRFTGPFVIESDSVHDIHVQFEDAFEGLVRLVYRECDLVDPDNRHHEVAGTYVHLQTRPNRFVWITPADTSHHGCLHAYSESSSIGKSEPISVSKPLHNRQSIEEVTDALGPWFDGVAYMQFKNVSTISAAEARSKKIAITGGGMSGLMTSLLLSFVGANDSHIIESI